MKFQSFKDEARALSPESAAWGKAEERSKVTCQAKAVESSEAKALMPESAAGKNYLAAIRSAFCEVRSDKPLSAARSDDTVWKVQPAATRPNLESAGGRLPLVMGVWLMWRLSQIEWLLG